jgi:methyl-accepting chemotaxis protein
MLVVAGTISILEFNWLSTTVHGLIQNNYKSIEASKSMIEALEREDSGILLLMLGELNEGRKILESSDAQFLESFEIAKNNLTEENEEDFIKKIEDRYDNYKSSWGRPIVDTEKQGNLTWYRTDIHQSFLTTKKAVDELMTLNQQVLFNEASFLREKSKRAIMPAIICIISAVVFSLLLSFFITLYFVSPIVRLTEDVNTLKPGQKYLKSRSASNDEIKKLELAINELLARFSDKIR